jgi:hypothetical protein
MNVLIGLIAATGLLALLATALVAYRWNRARPNAAAASAQWPAELTEPDTQAGRI